MKKQDISRLKIDYGLHFKLGMIISIALIALAFQWTVEEPDYSELKSETLIDEPDIVIERTVYERPPQLPPPAPAPSDRFIEQDIEFIEEPLPEKIAPVITSVQDEIPPSIQPVISREKPVAPPLPDDPEEIEDFFVAVEEMPRFKGCEELLGSSKEKEQCANQLMLKYIYGKITYPQMARQEGIEGTVVVRFIVEKDGSISNVDLLRDIGGGCGQQVVKIVQQMPDWMPGKQRGRAVRVQFSLPVKYRLD